MYLRMAPSGHRKLSWMKRTRMIQVIACKNTVSSRCFAQPEVHCKKRCDKTCDPTPYWFCCVFVAMYIRCCLSPCRLDCCGERRRAHVAQGRMHPKHRGMTISAWKAWKAWKGYPGQRRIVEYLRTPDVILKLSLNCILMSLSTSGTVAMSFVVTATLSVKHACRTRTELFPALHNRCCTQETSHEKS